MPHWETFVKFGLLYLPTYVPELDGPVGRFYNSMLEQIDAADQLGYDSVWLTEHHFDVYGGTLPNPAVLGAQIAQRTRRIRIGTAVTVLPLHNPLIVAEDFAMLDVISDGRLEMGIGRGSVLGEFDQFGISHESSSEVMEEAAEVLLRAWREDRFEHRGNHFSYPPLTVLPRPIQQPHPPVWLGASRTPATFAWAGRHGFHLMILPYMMPPAAMQERLDLYYQGLREGGHDASNVQIFAKFHVFVADSMDEAIRLASPHYDHYQRIASNRSGKRHNESVRKDSSFEQHVKEFNVIAGSPEDCIERVRYWRDTLGITHIGGTFHFGGLSQETTLRSIELFAQEVAPVFKQEAAQLAATR